jgi:hypothetical protein
MWSCFALPIKFAYTLNSKPKQSQFYFKKMCLAKGPERILVSTLSSSFSTFHVPLWRLPRCIYRNVPCDCCPHPYLISNWKYRISSCEMVVLTLWCQNGGRIERRQGSDHRPALCPARKIERALPRLWNRSMSVWLAPSVCPSHLHRKFKSKFYIFESNRSIRRLLFKVF